MIIQSNKIQFYITPQNDYNTRPRRSSSEILFLKSSGFSNPCFSRLDQWSEISCTVKAKHEWPQLASNSGPINWNAKSTYYSYVTGARKGDNVRMSPCPFSVTKLMFFVSTSVTCIYVCTQSTSNDRRWPWTHTTAQSILWFYKACCIRKLPYSEK